VEVFLRNQIPIQTSILDRLGEVGGLNTLLALKVGDGAGGLEHPRVGPGGEAEFIDGQFQQFLARLFNLAELLDMAVGHLGIAVDLQPFVSVSD